MKTLTLVNGNGKSYKQQIPKIHYLTKGINEVALNHIYENTGLQFKEEWFGYSAQPTDFKQITALFLTYNFKTEYHDNASNKNTLFLKGMFNVGFKVEHICYDCVKANNITTNGMDKKSRLSC